MPGPAPKHPSTRARRNRSSSAATLTRPDRAEIPALPDPPPLVEYDEDKNRHTHEVDWHPLVVEWWNDVWASPMSSEWDDSDVHNVYICLLLQQDMWTASLPRDRRDAAAEYRLQRKDLGLTPFDRRRLEWTIEQADEARERGAQRRASRKPAPRPADAGGKPDPRGGLSVVS